jgi:hypothetical protein
MGVSGAGATEKGGRGGATLQSVNWSRSAGREAKRQQAREQSPDIKTIDAANAAEFDERLAHAIASEGLDLDRDWYLREEDGGFDGDEGRGGLGDEESYARAKTGQDSSKASVRTMFLSPVPTWVCAV